MQNKYQKRIRRGLKTKAIQRQAKHANKPRLVVFRSNKNVYIQVIQEGRVIVACSTKDKELAAQLNGNKVEQAFQVGKLLGARALEKEIKVVAFDRSGFKYHGRIKALADGAREAGLNF